MGKREFRVLEKNSYHTNINGFIVRRIIDDRNPITPVQSIYAITENILFFKLNNTLKITLVYNYIRFDIVQVFFSSHVMYRHTANQVERINLQYVKNTKVLCKFTDSLASVRVMHVF